MSCLVNRAKSDYKMRQNPTIMFPNLPACYSGDFGSEANLFKFWVLIFYRNKILSKSPFLNVVFWIWYWNTNSILNQKNRKIWDSHWMLKIIGWRKYLRFPSYLIRQRRWRLKPCKPISAVVCSRSMRREEKSYRITSLPFHYHHQTKNNSSNWMQLIYLNTTHHHVTFFWNYSHTDWSLLEIWL